MQYPCAVLVLSTSRRKEIITGGSKLAARMDKWHGRKEKAISSGFGLVNHYIYALARLGATAVLEAICESFYIDTQFKMTILYCTAKLLFFESSKLFSDRVQSFLLGSLQPRQLCSS